MQRGGRLLGTYIGAGMWLLYAWAGFGLFLAVCIFISATWKWLLAIFIALFVLYAYRWVETYPARRAVKRQRRAEHIAKYGREPRPW